MERIRFKIQTLIALLHDFVMIIVAYYLSYLLRFDFILERAIKISPNFYKGLIVFIIVNFISLLSYGLYRGIWRYSSIPDLLKIIQAVTTGVFFSAGTLFFVTRLENFPRSIFILYWGILILLLGGGRFIYRLWRDNLSRYKFKSQKQQVLIVGAGAAGEQILREISKNPALKQEVVGLIDDDPRKQGRTLLGYSIKGQVKDLPRIVKVTGATLIHIAIPSADSAQLRRILDTCKDSKVEFRTLPKLDDFYTEVKFAHLRKIKPEDLLGREAVKLDLAALGDMIDNHTIMVTGAGGSIGSELCRQIAKFKPMQLVLFEMCELFLFDLENELREDFPNLKIIPVIGDVRNKDQVFEIHEKYKPWLVLHAAAYKHVPLMEHNPMEAIKTNVFGTKNLAEAAVKFDVKKFVMISTDKAVNPTNVMGSSKRIAEMLCTHYQSQTKTCQFITVRFGNVLGSNGSVIPTFKKQIEKGGPVTVTHQDITRYFMSIPEASQLVLQAGTLGNGGEIFVLDMGEPVKIIDLARDMIELAGFTPDKEIEIKYTGLRPGEKMYEELFSDKENLTPTKHPKVKIARVRENPLNFEQLVLLFNKNNYLTQIRTIVPESKIN